MNRIGMSPHLDVLGLSLAERAEVQRQGAKAAARGEPATTNPLAQPCSSSAATRGSADRRVQLSVAWGQGHAAQTVARRKVPSNASQRQLDEHD